MSPVTAPGVKIATFSLFPICTVLRTVSGGRDEVALFGGDVGALDVETFDHGHEEPIQTTGWVCGNEKEEGRWKEVKANTTAIHGYHAHTKTHTVYLPFVVALEYKLVTKLLASCLYRSNSVE